MKLTIDQALQRIHREYEGDTDYLEFDDEETQLRVEYLKDGIDEWLGEFPDARESIQSLADASTGDNQTDADGITDLPDNFVRPAGKVKLGDSTYLDYLDPAHIMGTLSTDANKRFYTVLGSPGEYQLRINPIQAAGIDLDLDFYGEVTMPTTTTELIPISRPLYAVFYALAKIYKEDDPEQQAKYEGLMQREIRREYTERAKTPGSPERLTIGGAGFGDTGGSISDIESGI